MLLIFLRQNPSASPASFKTLPKASLRDIAAVKPLQYWITIVYLFYYTITLSIRTVSFLYSD